MQETYETLIQSLSWEDPLEEDMATDSYILAWSPMDRGTWRVLGVSKSWTRLEWLSMHTSTHAGTVSPRPQLYAHYKPQCPAYSWPSVNIGEKSADPLRIKQKQMMALSKEKYF